MSEQRRAPRPRHPPHGLHRCADRPGQPAGVPRERSTSACCSCAAPAASWRCCSPTSTTSSASTTPSATTPATKCWCSSPTASARRSSASAATARCWRASAATNSSSCSRAGTGTAATCAPPPAGWPKRWSAELSRPIVVQDRQVFLGTSIGITLFPEDASGATMLMKNGDIAMYQAKVAGKNCYRFYSRAMDQAVERRVRMEQDLRGAWERGELSRRLPADLPRSPTAAWSAPRRCCAGSIRSMGVIAPSVFIDVAEQSGLIETIGPQVLRAACTRRDALADATSAAGDDAVRLGQRLAAPVAQRRPAAAWSPTCLRDTGLAAAAAAPGADRDRGDRRRDRTPARCCRACAAPASRSGWTISAPASPA